MRKVKLVVKGTKEPLLISEEDGIQARSLIEDSDIDPSQRVRIGEWSGYKSEIRYVFFEDESDNKDTKHFTDSEMNDFKIKIEPFTVKEGDEEYENQVKRFISATKSDKETRISPDMRERIESLQTRHLNESDLKIEAEKYVQDNYVGELTLAGERKFLEYYKAIRTYKDGTYHIILDSKVEFAYPELSEKLQEYQRLRGNTKYARTMDRKELDILAQSMEVPDFVGENEATQ